MRFFLTILALLFLVVGAPATTQAHQTGQSVFVAHIKPETRQVDTLLTFPARDPLTNLDLDTDADGEASLEELRAAMPAIAEAVGAALTVRNDGEPCEVVETKTSAPEQSLQKMWYLQAFQCQRPLGSVTLVNTAMVDSPDGGYSHIGQIQLGERLHTTAFNEEFPSYTIQVGPSRPGYDEGASGGADDTGLLDLLLRYVWQGVLHIVFGLDHVLFVVMLVLISRRVRPLLLAVTAFTLAHSVTLILSALDVLSISPAIIEPIIAASIVYVALETLLRDEEPRYLFALTFAFGLVHGFGFSYVLRDEVGLPSDALVPALASFNVGVELGQIAIVALLAPLRMWAKGRPWERRALQAVSLVVLAVALYWLVERTLLA